MKRPKLLFLITEDWYFWSHRLPIARAALREGYEVVVATRVIDHEQRIRDEGFRLIALQLNRSSYSPWKEFGAILELRRLYRAEKPDIVHHVALKPVLYGSLAILGRKNTQVINAFAGLGYLSEASSAKAWILRRFIWNSFRFLLTRRNSHVLLQNREDREFVTAKLGVCAAKANIIRGAGVDVNLYRPMPEPDGVPIVLLPARMLWNKGVLEFVEAASLLKSKRLDARFVLAGDSDSASPSAIPRKQLLEWKASGVVELWGHRNDMPQVIAQANLVCLPSYREGVPKSLLEAAASGRAIVTTDVPGCRDVVRQGSNGILVAPKDSVGLAHAIEELLKDSSRRHEMGIRGREIAVCEFSEEIVVEQTLALYREILRQCAEAGDGGRRTPEITEVGE